MIKRTFAFEHGDVREYAGNIPFYLTERVARKERLVRAFKNQQREIDRQQRLVDRFRAKASTSMVQSRIKRLDKIEGGSRWRRTSEISFKFPQPKPSGVRGGHAGGRGEELRARSGFQRAGPAHRARRPHRHRRRQRRGQIDVFPHHLWRAIGSGERRSGTT
ncbi:MAG: hypothetical protein R3F11_23310 [Verrucomicrobiales bacterium]